MDKEAYEIKKDGMTRTERRAYERMLEKQKRLYKTKNNRYEENNQDICR